MKRKQNIDTDSSIFYMIRPLFLMKLLKWHWQRMRFKIKWRKCCEKWRFNRIQKKMSSSFISAVVEWQINVQVERKKSVCELPLKIISKTHHIFHGCFSHILSSISIHTMFHHKTSGAFFSSSFFKKGRMGRSRWG